MVSFPFPEIGDNQRFRGHPAGPQLTEKMLPAEDCPRLVQVSYYQLDRCRTQWPAVGPVAGSTVLHGQISKVSPSD